MVSVAVDRRYIPLGSTLLAAVPVLDENNNFIGHEYRILTAQDVGGAIKGKGRMDFFCGTGEAGKKRSGALNHYGKVWLLLPK
jgi:membrane-bound lytic murein transglycosylase A